MKQVVKLVKTIISFITGVGFFGVGLLLWSLFAWFFVKGYVGNAVAWAFIGAFIGKNAQAVKAKIGGELPPDDDE